MQPLRKRSAIVIMASVLVGIFFAPVAQPEETYVITGSALMACAVALEDFRNHESGSNIENFIVHIRDNVGAFEVIFVPNQTPQDPDSTTYNLTVGGKTSYGREVHYVISKDTYEVVRKHFAR